MDISAQPASGVFPSQGGDSSLTGVYAVSGVVDGGVYVGASTNLARREREHFTALENNRHYNVKLQGAFRKHGRNNCQRSVKTSQ